MYVWKEHADEPIKEFDDVQDAIRYAIHTDKTKKKLLMTNKPFIKI